MSKKKKRAQETFAEKPVTGGEKEFRIPIWGVVSVFFLWLILFGKRYFASYPLYFHFLNIPDISVFILRTLEVIVYGLPQVLWMAAILSVSYGIGKTILKIFRLEKEGLEQILFSFGLGFGFLIYFILLLASLGLLYPLPIKIAFAIVAIFFLWKIKIPSFQKDLNPSFLKLRWKICFFIFFAFSILNLLMAFMPETFYDALVYHLSVPNYYLLKHKIAPMPYLMHSNFPLNINMLYLWGLVLHDEMLAKLIHFALTLLSGLTVYAAMKKFYSIESAVVSTLIYYSMPILVINSWECGNDAGPGFFFGLAVFSWLNWGNLNKKSCLFMSAIFLGIMLGAKYTNVFGVFGLFCVVTFMIFKNRMENLKLKTTATYVLITSVFILPYLIKNYLLTGNPVHPFLFKILGGQNLYDFGGGGAIVSGPLNLFNFNFVSFVRSFWDMTLNANQPQDFIGPMFLFLVPILLFVKKQDKNLLLLFCGFIVSYISWYMGTPMFRYLMPSFICLSMIIGHYSAKIFKQNILFFFVFAFLLTSNFTSLLNIAYISHLRPYLGQKTNKDEFLSISHPSYPNPPYKAIKWINENLPKNAKILFSGENKSYYLKREYVTYSVENNLQPLMEFLKQSKNEKDFLQTLKSEGITHLLINYREAVRVQPSYKTYYWSKREREIFNEFWKQNVKLKYFAEGTYVYAVEKTTEPEVNVLDELEKKGWSRQNLMQIFEEQKMWNSLLDEYEDFSRYGIDVQKQINVLKFMIQNSSK